MTNGAWRLQYSALQQTQASTLKLVIAFLLASLLSGNVRSELHVPGTQEVVVASPARGGSVPALVWYPTRSTEKPTPLGGSGVFVGVNARPDAPVAFGEHPLVLIAHGGFRSAANSASWFASAMTEQGYIAVVVTPPLIPPGPPRSDVVNEISLRPLDLSGAISALETHEAFRDRIDFDRIAVAGFFLGGYSALALAGLELDAELLAGSCAQENRSVDCDWFGSGSVDLKTMDLQKVVRSVRDRRVRAVVAVDAEWLHSASPQSLGNLSASAHFINVGPWGLAGSLLNMAETAQAISGASYTRISPAGRFSTFGECTEKALRILKQVGEDVRLCTDGDGKESRAKIHRRIVETIARELNDTFGR